MFDRRTFIVNNSWRNLRWWQHYCCCIIVSRKNAETRNMTTARSVHLSHWIPPLLCFGSFLVIFLQFMFKACRFIQNMLRATKRHFIKQFRSSWNNYHADAILSRNCVFSSHLTAQAGVLSQSVAGNTWMTVTVTRLHAKFSGLNDIVNDVRFTHIWMFLPEGLGSSPGAQTDHPHIRSSGKRNSGRSVPLFSKQEELVVIFAGTAAWTGAL